MSKSILMLVGDYVEDFDILALRKRRGFPDGDQCPDREALDASLPDALWQWKPPSRRTHRQQVRRFQTMPVRNRVNSGESGA